MTGKILLGTGWLLGLVLGSGFSVRAVTMATSQDLAVQDLAVNVETVGRLADGHIESVTPSFSLQYPQDSQVTVRSEDSIEIVSSVPVGDSTMDLHTQARLLREGPADVVGPYIEQLLEADALVTLYRTVVVDGRSGFRIWLGERPDPQTGELTNSLVTFVGYGSDQTAQIISYYSDELDEATVLALHDSFTHLAPPDASP